MEKLVEKLFNNRKRRLELLILWNLRQPVEGKCLWEIFKKFLTTILYERIEITMTESNLSLFKNRAGLVVPYKAMKTDERALVWKIYQNRHSVFGSLQLYQTNGLWTLTKYKSTKPLLTTKYRREMVRDFVLFLVSKRNPYRHLILYPLIVATQVMIEQEKRQDDVFLCNLHDRLQGIGNINNLLVIYE